MQNYIEKFPDHILDAINIAEKATLNIKFSNISNIVISGQGGSGISGIIAQNIFNTKSSVPIVINQDYKIPSFVGEKTLFISSSYSGNTEETLVSLNTAINKKSQIICVCSGGELLEKAKQNHLNYILIPKGAPPRAMLAYSLIQILFILYLFEYGKNGIIDLKKELIKVNKYLNKHQSAIIDLANSLSKRISSKMPFIYTYSELEGVALRFKQQLNENAKRHACYNIIPEMNHNEIVGWSRDSMCSSLVFINGFTSEKNKKRMMINIEQLSQKVEDVIELMCDTNSHIQEYFYFLHLVDWISLILANNDGVDPNEIDAINYLKKELKNS